MPFNASLAQRISVVVALHMPVAVFTGVCLELACVPRLFRDQLAHPIIFGDCVRQTPTKEEKPGRQSGISPHCGEFRPHQLRMEFRKPCICIASRPSTPGNSRRMTYTTPHGGNPTGTDRYHPHFDRPTLACDRLWFCHSGGAFHVSPGRYLSVTVPELDEDLELESVHRGPGPYGISFPGASPGPFPRAETELWPEAFKFTSRGQKDRPPDRHRCGCL
ncbi:hypothetical protein LXA43DRAFT_1066196 [Ganoderma leucocontextum]|nr:hypothetical protein LXA43DRAFT_1066196 [Ganoderma leucocontextum]